MANCCWFEIHCIGFRSEEDKKSFIDVFENSYYGSKYGTQSSLDSNRPWMAIYGAEIEERESEVIITGECKWSLLTSMLNRGIGSYYCSDKDSNYTCLEVLSEKYHITLEAYSEESGMCFQEHYVIKNGQIITDECVDWSTFYPDADTYEEFCEGLSEEEKSQITRKMYDEAKEYGCDITLGGFGDWEFTAIENYKKALSA